MPRPMMSSTTHKNVTMTDDSLRILRFLANDLAQTKIVKGLFWMTLLTHVILGIVEIYYILYVITDVKQNMCYTGVLIADFYPLFAIVMLLDNDKLTSNLFNELSLWKIESTGPEIFSKIQLETKLVTVFAVFTFVAATCAGLSFFIDLSHDLEWFFALRFIQNNYPENSRFLSFMYDVTFVVFGYAMVMHPLQGIYYMQHFKYQLILLREVIMNLDRGRQGPEVQLFYDRVFQDKIEQWLRFCIVRWNECIRIYRRKTTDMGKLILGLSFGGCLLGISLLLVLLSGRLTPEYYPRQVVTCVAATLAFCGIIASGQSVETQFAEMGLAISNVRWYNFDKRNKDLYLVLTMDLMTVRKLKATENYAINYQLGLAIVRGIYSIITVFANMDWK